MYIRGLILRIFAELAEAVPIGASYRGHLEAMLYTLIPGIFLDFLFPSDFFHFFLNQSFRSIIIVSSSLDLEQALPMDLCPNSLHRLSTGRKNHH